MKNKILGLIIVLIAAVIVMSISATAAGISMQGFFSPVSLIWVVGVAGGLTLMNQNKNTPNNELFPVLKQSLLFAGYSGTLVGLILSFAGYQESGGIQAIFIGVSASGLPLLYGYSLAYLLEPFFNK